MGAWVETAGIKTFTLTKNTVDDFSVPGLKSDRKLDIVKVRPLENRLDNIKPVKMHPMGSTKHQGTISTADSLDIVLIVGLCLFVFGILVVSFLFFHYTYLRQRNVVSFKH